uniref:Uncharacterized protein n=1 Tax=Anguilla anguilla TaxID=7936 RepID=A0A0E9SCK0_ANGAN
MTTGILINIQSSWVVLGRKSGSEFVYHFYWATTWYNSSGIGLETRGLYDSQVGCCHCTLEQSTRSVLLQKICGRNGLYV